MRRRAALIAALLLLVLSALPPDGAQHASASGVAAAAARGATPSGGSGGEHAVIVKFGEQTGVRLRGGRLVDGAGALLVDVEDRAARHGAADIARVFDRPEATLAAEHALAEASARRDVADLNLFYRIEVDSQAAAAALAADLAALPNVETAYVAPLPAPLPVTPDFQGLQGYLDAAPGGIDASAAWAYAGGRGAGVTIADVEYSWNHDQEDLPTADASMILLLGGETLTDPFNDKNHGTAVLGELIAANNGFGVTGIASDADIRMAPAMINGVYNVANAINRARSALSAGDVILIEQQTPGANGGCSFDQTGCVPVEYNAAEFAAIQTATSLGIIVVEAAGNGSEDLDGVEYAGTFDRNVRDSGAIIVGAGAAPGGFDPARSKLWFSSYGSRVDLQGWGNAVTTLGYGGLQGGASPNTWYTSSFSGTSSASPMVAGGAAVIQGIRLAAGQPLLSPLEMREALTITGTPQQDSASYPAALYEIGRLPNLPAAITMTPNVLHDHPGNARIVMPPYPWQYSQSTDNATVEDGEPSPCGLIGSTIWFSITPIADGVVTANTVGSDFNTVLAAYQEGSMQSPPAIYDPVALTCNDDAGGAQSAIMFPVVGGTTYYIQAGGAFAAQGMLDIEVACSEDDCLGPGNDLAQFAEDVGLPLPWQFLQFTSGASLEGAEPLPCGDFDRTVWFRFTPPAAGSFTVETYGSTYDTVLAVYQEAPMESPPVLYDPVAIACNDDSSGPQSALTFPGEADMTYHVQVGGSLGDYGTLLLTVTCGADHDCDTVLDGTDNCLSVANLAQTNTDANPQFPGADALGDACDADDDGDGCTDVEEQGGVLSLGGLRNALSPWDFADVPTPALPAASAKNKAITIQDVNSALAWVGRSTSNGTGPDGRNYLHDNNANGVADGSEYDRTAAGPVSGPPNGGITLSDVGVVLGQVGHSCAGPPN